MFLSSTDQNNPSSSSSSFLHLTNSCDELGQSHLSTFSIRDYAFSYRTKNIKKSWPFSSTSLQLCLRHGLTDPLPPIQLLPSVIIHPPQALPLKKPNISCKRKSQKQGFDDDNGLLATTTTTTTSGPKSRLQVANVNKNPRKKIGCVESGSKEDQSCLFAVSESSMALRTCPICKTFSSASNTTLNAHIDQCLSVDSALPPVCSKPNRPRITKPRLKVKTMVDIYASAKACTLEDLDKRNGTKWAMVSSYSSRVVSDNKHEVSTNKGKKRSLLRDRVDEDAPGIGPVYIDDKGQKLRILSEFKEKTSDPSRVREDVSERKKKSSSKGKGNESFRKRLHRKHRKLAPQSRKLSVRKGNASEVHEYRRAYAEEGRGIDRSEYHCTDQRRILNERMLRKRGLSKKGTQIGDEPSENRHSLSGDDAHVLRGPSHVSTDLSSETVSASVNSQNSWRSQVYMRKSNKSASFVSNPLRCSVPADKVFATEAKGFMKLKKARFDFSENEDEDDEDTGKWESEMTQEREMTDDDDWDGTNGETNEVLLSSNHSVNGEDNDYESSQETGDDDDMLNKRDEFDCMMIYEKSGCEAAEQGSSFMEVDPIPIPGPPGSFLPSPWDMGTDAIGNSSVITSQLQSSQDQLDFRDRNSSESPVSNFAAPPPETHTLISSLHNIIDKRPSRFRDNDDQSCCCQRKEKAFEDTTTFGKPLPPPPHNQDLDLLSKSVPAIPNPVLRLMGKDLMVINQREETSSHVDSSLKTPNSQFLDLSKTTTPLHLRHRRPFDTSTSFYNFP